MVAGDITDIFDVWDRSSLKVGAPVKTVFVCGGTTPEDQQDDLTRRDALFEILDSSESDIKSRTGLDKYIYKKAEAIDGFVFREHYQDWLTLELDIARISEVTMLFCESPGAFAELGSFVVDPEIVKSLIVLIDHDKYKNGGYIRHGILTFLEKTQPQGSVFVLQAAEMGLSSLAMKGKDIDREKFGSAVSRALRNRLEQPVKHRTFNPSLSGHLIKLITGLVQEYGALTINEIWYLLEGMGISLRNDEINRYVFCAETMEWVTRDRREFEEYITLTAPTDSANCIAFTFRDGGVVQDRRRWRADVRAYWKKHDHDRFASIASCWGA